MKIFLYGLAALIIGLVAGVMICQHEAKADHFEPYVNPIPFQTELDEAKQSCYSHDVVLNVVLHTGYKLEKHDENHVFFLHPRTGNGMLYKVYQDKACLIAWGTPTVRGKNQ